MKEGDFSPFLEQESAVVWLSRRLQQGAPDLMTMYHLSIVNLLTENGNQINKRLPAGITEKNRYKGEELSVRSDYTAKHRGGGKNVKAALIARAVAQAEYAEHTAVGKSGYTKLQEIIGLWAERDGCWHDNANTFVARKRGMKYLKSGSESDVYDNGRGEIIKVTDITHYGSLQKALDKIDIHNATFPETALEVIGFGLKDTAFDNSGYSIIVKQRSVEGVRARDMQSIDRMMADKGFSRDNTTAIRYVSEEKDIVIHDINPDNAVVDTDGNIIVFDCDAYLNAGGYAIPDIKFSEENVRKINDTLLEICPKSIFFSELDRLCPQASRILRDGQKIEGTVMLRDGRAVTLDRDPDSSLRVLVQQPCNSFRLIGGEQFTASQRKALSEGCTVKTDEGWARFDLAKARVVTYPRQPLTLKVDVKKKQSI